MFEEIGFISIFYRHYFVCLIFVKDMLVKTFFFINGLNNMKNNFISLNKFILIIVYLILYYLYYSIRQKTYFIIFKPNWFLLHETIMELKMYCKYLNTYDLLSFLITKNKVLNAEYNIVNIIKHCCWLW